MGQRERRKLHSLDCGLNQSLICRDQVPWQQRAGNLAALVAGIGECMASRYTNLAEQVWRVAVPSFNAIVELGLPAVNISYVNDEEPPGPDVWRALTHAFEGYALSNFLDFVNEIKHIWLAGVFLGWREGLTKRNVLKSDSLAIVEISNSS